MIWGLILEPGKLYTEIVQDEVQLSMATLESRGDSSGDSKTKFSHIVMATDNAEYLLCTLVNGATYQQNLDLKIMPQEKVTFSVQGASKVYLMGYSTVYPDINEELTAGEDQDLPGWEEFSVDEQQEDSAITGENDHSQNLNTSPGQGAPPSSETPREGDELVSSVGSLVENWADETEEQEENFFVESVKPEQIEDGDDVFPIANVKEEPASPVASMTNTQQVSTHQPVNSSISRTTLELRSFEKDSPGSSSPSSTWPVQINVEQDDTSNYGNLVQGESDFLSQTGVVKIGEHSSLQETPRRELVTTSGHYPIENQGVSYVDQMAKTTVSRPNMLPTVNTANQFLYQPLSNPQQQLMSNSGGHAVAQRGSPNNKPSQSLRTLQRGRGSLSRGRHIPSRGLSRGTSHTFQMNAGGRRQQGLESPSSSRWSGPSSSSSSVISYQGDGSTGPPNQSVRAGGYPRAGTGHSKHHTCEICQKSFVTMSLLKRHQVIHTGLKPHKCPMCPSSFARNDNLLRHLKNNHKEAYTYFRGGLKNS